MNKPRNKRTCSQCHKSKRLNEFSGTVHQSEVCTDCAKIETKTRIQDNKARKEGEYLARQLGELPAPKREAYKDSGCRKKIEQRLEDIKFSAEWDDV